MVEVPRMRREDEKKKKKQIARRKNGAYVTPCTPTHSTEMIFKASRARVYNSFKKVKEELEYESCKRLSADLKSNFPSELAGRWKTHRNISKQPYLASVAYSSTSL